MNKFTAILNANMLQYSSLVDRVETTEEKCTTLSDELAVSKSDGVHLKGKVELLQSQCEGLSDELTVSKSDGVHLKGQVKLLQSQCEGLSDELAVSKSDGERIKEQLELLKTKCQELKENKCMRHQMVDLCEIQMMKGIDKSTQTDKIQETETNLVAAMDYYLIRNDAEVVKAMYKSALRGNL